MNDIIECDVNREQIKLCVDDSNSQAGYWNNVEMWRAKNYANFESDTLEWIDGNFNNGDVIYDIGANIGQYSLYVAKRLKNNCKILAFEPESLNYAKLNKNIVANDLSQTILPYCFAITDKTKIDILSIHSFRPGAALHNIGNWPPQGSKRGIPSSAREASSNHKQGIIGISIDDLVNKFNMPFPNHMKIDVDGFESMVVDGGLATIEDTRLKSVSIEVLLSEGLEVFEKIKNVFLERGFIFENESSFEFEMGTGPNLIFKRT